MGAVGQYYKLTKPGIIYSNALAGISGFLLASKGHIDITTCVAFIVGMSFVIASGCVFNNYTDRHIDAVMIRTKQRATVTGAISERAAILFGSILGVAGFSLLAVGTNWTTVAIGLIGYFDYVVFYGLAKRASEHGTLVGSISGAVPAVAGYTAVTGSLDGAAILLFIIMVFWQMPHFYAIAIYRRKEYAAAKLPVLPVKKTVKRTKEYITLYVLAFFVTAPLLTVFGYTGIVYAAGMLLLGFWWLLKALTGLNVQANANTLWARSLFRVSLIVLLGWCVLLSFNVWLP